MLQMISEVQINKRLTKWDTWCYKWTNATVMLPRSITKVRQGEKRA